MKTFEELEASYKYVILSVIKNINVDFMTKEDLYQECLMVLHKCSMDYSETRNVKFITYFISSMKNRIYNIIKHSNRGKRAKLVIMDMDEHAQVEEESYENVLEDFIKELDKMPRGDITKRIYLDGKTMKEVAKEDNISEQRVQYLNKRNLEKLRELFNVGV